MTGVAIDTSNGLVYVAGTSKSTLELLRITRKQPSAAK